MSKITIRVATEHDAEAIVALWHELAGMHQELVPLVWSLCADAEQGYRSHLSDMMQDPNARVLVAEGRGEVVGYAVAHKSTRPPGFAHSSYGSFSQISVSPSARLGGVGKALVEAGLEWFLAEGISVAETSYAADNPTSVPFWEALGFRPYQIKGLRVLTIPQEPLVCEGVTYFASVAENYDRLQPIVAGPSYEAGLAFVLEFLPRDADDAFTCVELGCGTATLTDRVLARFPRASAIAIDSEPAMLTVARRKLERYGDRAQVRKADAVDCEVPSCQVVLSSFMFHHVPPDALVKTLRRIARALTPGGCFILLDQMTAGPAWGEQVGAQSRRLYRSRVATAIAAGLTTQAEIDARWEFKRRMKTEGKDIEYRHRAEDLLAAMQDAGFAEVGLVWRMFAATVLVGFVEQGELE